MMSYARLHSLVLCLAVGLAAPAAFAQDSGDGNPPAAQTNSTDRVPVPEPSDKALAYYHSGNVLYVVNLLLGFVLPALFLFTGWSAKLRNLAGRFGRNWFLTIALYYVMFTGLIFVIELPLAYYQGFLRPHAYDLSNQTFAKWAADTFKSLGVGTLTGVLTIWVPYLLLARSPKRWWLYTSLAAAPFYALMLFITPLWISPLFNDFGPMQNKELEAKILELADRSDIEGARVFEVEKSVDTKTVNAYVTGIGDTKRIVLWDTLIARLDEDEVLFVMGHEMGHYVLGHVYYMMLLLSAGTFGALFLADRLARYVFARGGDRMNVRELADIASLPLLMLLVQMLSLFATPALLAYSRYNEHESDRFGLELTQNNRACAQAFAKLQEQNLANPRPGPLYKFMRAGHPPLGERIDYCNDYRPWETGEPLVYGKLFSDP